MPNPQQLREQRANIWEQMKEVMATAEREGRDLTAEERQKYDRAEGDLDRLAVDIERQERHEQRAADLDKVDRSGIVPNQRESADSDKDTRYSRAFGELIRNGAAEMDPEDKRALAAGWVDKRDLGVGTATAGGYTVAPGFRDRIIETARAFGGMLQVAEVINTDTGANLQWPTNDDTANVGAILAENTQVTEQDVTLGTNSLDAFMYTSKLVRTSYQLLQDSAFDVEDWLARRLGERLGRILNQHFTTGTGTAQPDGIVTGSTVGKVGAAGQLTTITYADILDLVESIDPAYQADASFMVSQGSRKMIRRLTDSQGRPLWEPGLQVGTPDSLLGYGMVVNQDMPAPAASAKSILFGNFREAYVIRLVTDVALLRLAERYADFLQVGFLAFQRADGTLQNGAAVRAYQHPAA